MELQHARYLAEGVVKQLAPLCLKVLICGSIRRHQKECSDIDIVCLPKRDLEKDMFGTVTGSHVIPEFIQAVNQWTKIKGEASGKYTQRLLKDGTHLEISIAQPNNYGNLVLIRTGDLEFSQLMMTAALKRGLKQDGGFLWNEDKIVPITEEEEYFRVLNLPYVEPSNRNKEAYK